MGARSARSRDDPLLIQLIDTARHAQRDVEHDHEADFTTSGAFPGDDVDCTITDDYP